MKCPWCSREIGLPAVSRTLAKCPICGGKVTYAFRGRKALKYLCISGAVAAVLAPFLGGIVIPLALIAPFVGSAYLERWY